MPDPDSPPARALLTERFAECLYITEYNEPVTLFSLERARQFGRRLRVPILWVQADDRPPMVHFGHLTPEQMAAKKKSNG